MYIKMILPALTEAKSVYWRSIKYSLFPPLGLATLAGYVPSADRVEIQDEHVERLDLDDSPDIVVIQVYITSAFRAYELADHYRQKGSYVCLGGLHVTAIPQEALRHADSIFLGPGEATFPAFLQEFRQGKPRRVYRSQQRTLQGVPEMRRDLIKRDLYLVPNSLVVSRGCPHRCDFCYKESFFEGGKSFYTQRVDRVLSEIDRLAGRHLFFLDDNLFADTRFATELFEGMRGMNRVWQAAGTVKAVCNEALLEKAVQSGLRSLFVGFETLQARNLREHDKVQNTITQYQKAVRRLHAQGVMINASFIFGMDQDDASVFDRTVDWAISNGIETATFHILTPYPGTRLYERLRRQKRILHSRWDLYDTRHAVYQPKQMSVQELEQGYWRAYKQFYQWSAIWEAAATKETLKSRLRHLAYAGGWKKFETLWKFIVNNRQVKRMLPLLEQILAGEAEKTDGCRETTRRFPAIKRLANVEY